MARSLPLALALICGVAAPGAGAAELDAKEVARRWASRLSGKHYVATVTLGPEDGERKRMAIRWDDSRKRERLLVRVEWPERARGRSWLMLENNDRQNEYYLYSTQKASSGVQRLRGVHKGNPFAGADFDYLHFRVAHHGRSTPQDVETVTLNGRQVYLLTETANEVEFERKIWLDPETFVPLRGQFGRKGKIFMTAETEKIQEVQGVATPIRIRFSLHEPPERTLLWTVERMDYEQPILESYFTPPRP